MSHDARRLRICARIQTLARKPVHNSRAPLTLVKFLVASSVNQFRCESFRIVYSLSRPQRPRSQDQRGFRNGASVQIGGGVHVGDALPSDCWFKTHSNMGTAFLCLNVSGRDFHLVCAPAQVSRTVKDRTGTRSRRSQWALVKTGRTSRLNRFAF